MTEHAEAWGFRAEETEEPAGLAQVSLEMLREADTEWDSSHMLMFFQDHEDHLCPWGASPVVDQHGMPTDDLEDVIGAFPPGPAPYATVAVAWIREGYMGGRTETEVERGQIKMGDRLGDVEVRTSTVVQIGGKRQHAVHMRESNTIGVIDEENLGGLDQLFADYALLERMLRRLNRGEE